MTQATRGPKEFTPADQLCWAAELGDLPAVQQLLAAGGDPNGRSTLGGWTALMRAATVAVVDTLLTSGADISLVDTSGQDALFFAIDAGNADVVRRLKAAGADIDARCQTGWTRLRTAAFQRNPDAVALLLELGADPRLDRGKLLSAAAWYALAGFQPATERTLELLFAAGEDVNAADEHGYTPLHCAVSGYAHTPSDATWWNASSDGSDITATRALLKHGADPNRAGIDTITPLLLAVRSTYEAVPCIRALVGGGADPNLATGAGTTPLMHAAGRGRLENVRTLLELGADPHRTDRYRQNALHYARRYLDQCREEAALEASPAAAYAPDDQFEALQSQALREQQVSAESCVALLKEILGG